MTDYTERFRTANIGQLQQGMAALASYVRSLLLERDDADAAALDRELDAILGQAPPFNIDPADEALIDAAMAKRESGLKVTPMARAADADSSVMQPTKSINDPSRIIRSGDLVVGKRYRIAEIWNKDSEPAHRIGDIVTVVGDSGELAPNEIRATRGPMEQWWLAAGNDYMGTFVTAVELVEDEAQQPNLSRSALRERRISGEPIVSPAEADPTIIRAAEGVTLEPGEYETPDTHHFTAAVALPAEREPMFGVWGWFVASWSQWVYAVRRVDPKPAGEPVVPAAGCELDESFCYTPEPSADVKRLNPYLDRDAKRPDGALELFIWGVRYYAGMLEDGDNWSHSLGHIEECCKEFDAAIKARRGTPPQQPEERVEPVAASDERPLLTKKLDVNMADLTRSQLESYTARLLCGLDGVNKERDAALATVARMEAEIDALTRQVDGEKHHRGLLSADLNALIDDKPVALHLSGVVRKKHKEMLAAAERERDEAKVGLEKAVATVAKLESARDAVHDRLTTIADELCGWQATDHTCDMISAIEKRAHQAMADVANGNQRIAELERREGCRKVKVKELENKVSELKVQLAEADERFDGVYSRLMAAPTEDELRSLRVSARAGLDPKACGELVATVRKHLPSWRFVNSKDCANAALDKLAAMLGVEVA